MTNTLRAAADLIFAAALRLLPPDMLDWGRAMRREMSEIPNDAAALGFAGGCLRTVVVIALTSRWKGDHSMMSSLGRSRTIGLISGAAAVLLGVAYMWTAGAPASYLAVNLGALVMGAAGWAALRPAGEMRIGRAGFIVMGLAVVLAATSLFGFTVEGASRWLKVGPFMLQVSLVVLPAMLVMYARQPDAIGTAGLCLASLALALQPDRAMAGVLAAALVSLAIAARRPMEAIAAAASILGFVYAVYAPDNLPAVPYVDQIYYTSFEVGIFAGFAVLAGAVVLVAPAVVGLLKSTGDLPALIVFGICWAAVALAAALGNYPTPLVGYGGAAILGYFLSAGLLPNRPSGQLRGQRRSVAMQRGPVDQNLSECRRTTPTPVHVL